MAKQKFNIAHDVRFNGKHVKAGSPIELDPQDDSDAASLQNLLSSNRIVDVDVPKAHKALAQPRPARPAPEAKPEPEQPAK